MLVDLVDFSDRPILLTDTNTDTDTDISVLVSLYRYRLKKVMKFHIGIGIGNYKIQISVSVLVKSIKAFVEKPLFFVTKVSISLKLSYLWVYNYVFTQSRLFMVLIQDNLFRK